MADFMTPEEMEAKAQALVEAFEAGAISAKEYNDGVNDVKKGIDGYTSELNQSLNQLGTSIKKLGQGMLDGQTGLSQYSDSIASGGDAIAKMTQHMGPMGVAAGMLLKVITFGISEISKQADALAKGYQDMAKSGAMGADGISGTYDTMKKFGYGVNQIGDFTKLIADNSENLAIFGGNALEGTEALAKMAKGIQSSGLQLQFMNMGMSVDSINKGIAGFAGMQASMGIMASDNEEAQRKAAQEYIETQDRLTKLTGKSADQLDQARKKAETIEAYNAQNLMNPENKIAMDAAFEMISAKSETLGLAFAASTTGMSGLTKESVAGQQMTGGQLAILTKQYKDNITAGMDQTKALAVLNQGLADASASTLKFHESAAAVGGDPNMAGLLEHSRVAAGAMGAASKAVMDTKTAQDKQKTDMNKNTEQYNKNVQEQMKTRDTLQDLVNDGIGPVTTMFEELSKVINSILHPFGGGKKEQAGGAGGTPGGGAPAGPSTTGATASNAGSTNRVQIKNAAGEVTETREGGNINWRNNNPGNIKAGEAARKMGAIGENGGFAVFETMEAGKKAADSLLKGANYANLNLTQAITKWAPPSENDPAAYARLIAKKTGLDVNAKYVDLTPQEQDKFLMAMNAVEGGKEGSVTRTAAGMQQLAQNKPPAPATGKTAFTPVVTASVPLPSGEKLPAKVEGAPNNANSKDDLEQKKLAALQQLRSEIALGNKTAQQIKQATT